MLFRKVGRVTLQVGRRKVTAIWDQRAEGKKEVFRFEGLAGQIAQGILGVKERIREDLDAALSGFARENGIVMGGPIWERAEESIRGDAYLDALPRDLVLHDTVFRKVYADEVEFLTRSGEEAGVRVKNYVKNRALEDLSPSLAEELRELRLEIHPAERVMELVKSLEDFGRADVRELVMMLDTKERERLSIWTFGKFGASPAGSAWMRVGRFVRWRCGTCGTSNVPGRARCPCGVGKRPYGEVEL